MPHGLAGRLSLLVLAVLGVGQLDLDQKKWARTGFYV